MLWLFWLFWLVVVVVVVVEVVVAVVVVVVCCLFFAVCRLLIVFCGCCFAYDPKTGAAFWRFFLLLFEMLHNHLPRYILYTCPNL